MRSIHYACVMTLLGLCVGLPSCIGPPLVITVEELPNAIEGTSYAAPLGAVDTGAAQWSATAGALPAGLHLDARTGQISGTPTQPGLAEFLVRVVAVGLPERSVEQWYTLRVIPKLTLTAALEAARVGTAYSESLTIAGGVEPYQVTIAGLPAGMDYDRTTGAIFGTPLFDYDELLLDITVTDAGDPRQTVTGTTTLVVKPRGVSIITDELANAAVGEVYSVTLQASDGKLPYEWRVAAGVLPDGLRLTRSTGVIAGTPTGQAATQTFTIAVEDADSPASTDTQECKIVVPVVIITSSLPATTVGGDYDEALGATAGLEPYAWELAAGQLPDGLELDGTTGVISGTVAGGAQSRTFTIRVTDSDTPATTQEVELTIEVS